MFSRIPGINNYLRQKCGFCSCYTNQQGGIEGCFRILSSTSAKLLLLYITGGTHEWKPNVWSHVTGEYWPHMANGLSMTVKDCREWVQNMQSKKWRRPLHLLLRRSPLEFIAMDILRTLSKTIKGNWFVLVMTYSYKKLTEAVLTSTVVVLHVVSLFMDNWFIPYGILQFVLTDNQIRLALSSRSQHAPC